MAMFYAGKGNLSETTKNAPNAWEKYGVEPNCLNIPQNFVFLNMTTLGRAL